MSLSTPKLHAIYFFDEDDKHHTGDYLRLEIHVNGELVIEYDDESHSGGTHRVEGWKDAFEVVYGGDFEFKESNRCEDFGGEEEGFVLDSVDGDEDDD